MIVAVPVTDGLIGSHFGHCDNFYFFETGPDGRTIRSRWRKSPPAHEPGVFPRWLKEEGADVVIAGGMGGRAQAMLAERGIEVVVGAPADDPERAVVGFLEGALKPGANPCDESHGSHPGCGGQGG